MARKLDSMFLLVAVLAATVYCSMAQTTHVVGGTAGWTFPQAAGINYTDWAAGESFVVGDILVFNFTTGFHNVMEVSIDSYDSCGTTNPISVENSGPANITLTTAGTHYYICAYSGHCQADMKVTIDVTAPSTSEPSPAPSPTEPSPAPSPPPTVPEPTSSPSPAPKTSPSPAPVTSPAPSPSGPQTFVVGGSAGWTFRNASFYQTWAANKTFSVGDTLVFNFTTGTHNVAEVSRDSFDTCNRTSLILVNNTGPASIKLTEGGAHYYICAFTGHCNAGMKLAINVTGASTPTSSPGPSPSATSSPAPSSSTPTTPSSPSATPPPPPSSAPSFAGAALPISLLAVALAFFY